MAKKYLTSEAIAQLGSKTDLKIAQELGVSRAFVRKEREKMGIEPHSRNANMVQFTPEMDALIGTDSDYSVAKLLKVSTKVVLRRRLELKKSSGYQTVWTQEMDALIATMADTDLAKQFKISYEKVVHRRRTLGIARFRKTKMLKSEARVLINASVSSVTAETLRNSKNTFEIPKGRLIDEAVALWISIRKKNATK